MQFCKFEGLISGVNIDAKKEADGEQTKNIYMRSINFNQNKKQKAYFFVSGISDNIATFGVIAKDCSDILKEATKYLKAIQVTLESIRFEEVTYGTLCKMLRTADRNNYIEDDDDVLEKFELEKLQKRRTGFEFGENIIDGCGKKEAYEQVKKLFAEETFVPELERICGGCARKQCNGHPVHYMIETDDVVTRKGMHRLLLGALYENRRLAIKRYSFIDINNEYDIPGASVECLYKSSVGGSIIIRYCAENDAENEYASSGRETIAKLCKLIKQYRNQVLSIICLPRECTDTKEIFYEYLGNISIVELKEDFVTGERAVDFMKLSAKENKIRADKKLLAKIEEDRQYLAPDLRNLFDEWYNEKMKNDIYPQYKNIATVKHEIIKTAPKGSAYDELNQMIGLDEAKKIINQALNYYKAQKLFSEKGMKTDRPAMHMIFTGNPGTAKTTVARLFARIMKENGLLSKGKLIEVGRGDLVGKYVGWTAPTIKNKFLEAKGSVLFIDEAYSLVDDCDGSFGDEAINTIVQEMENHREEVIVIFAGYTDKMEGFLQKNPGLRSRIAYHVPFDDYDTASLCKIAELIAKQKGLCLTAEACDKLANIFEEARQQNDFGNGRYARNIIEKARMAQAQRLISMDIDSVGKKEISTICADDIEIPQEKAKKKRHKIGFCA